MNYEPTYNAVHKWLAYHFGKAKSCKRCSVSNEDRRYEYALIKGKKYEKKRENFLEMCAPCHKLYDNIIENLTAKKYKPISGEKGGKVYRFSSVSEAHNELGILRTSISNCLKGRSLSAGGYKWTYA